MIQLSFYPTLFQESLIFMLKHTSASNAYYFFFLDKCNAYYLLLKVVQGDSSSLFKIHNRRPTFRWVIQVPKLSKSVVLITSWTLLGMVKIVSILATDDTNYKSSYLHDHNSDFFCILYMPSSSLTVFPLFLLFLQKFNLGWYISYWGTVQSLCYMSPA